MPDVVGCLDEIGGWISRLDLLLILAMAVLIARRRIRWTSKYLFLATKRVLYKTGVKGFLFSAGAPLVFDIVLLPVLITAGLRCSGKPKSIEDYLTDIKINQKILAKKLKDLEHNV